MLILAMSVAGVSSLAAVFTVADLAALGTVMEKVTVVEARRVPLHEAEEVRE